MDTGHLTLRLVSDLDPPARPVVIGYLRELAAALPGPRRTREAILTEIADGLIEQITNTAGTDPAMVARSAIHWFGSPRSLAAQFAPEITGKTAHRTGFALVSSGPLVGGLWLLALTGGQPPALSLTLQDRIAGMFSVLPLIPVLLLLIIPTALVAIAGAGRATRILPITTTTAGLAGLVASIGCAMMDVTLIGHAMVSSGAWSPLLIAATTVSSARLILAAAAARRCAQFRFAC